MDRSMRTIIVIGAITCAIVGAMFGYKKYSLHARTTQPSFVTFIDDFEDLSNSQYRDTFGWGGGDIVGESVKQLGPNLTHCRQYKTGDDNTFRYEVKVSVGLKKFRVVGILEGAEKNQEMAACIRDKINETTIESLSQLSPASESSYRLKIGVQTSRGQESY